MSRAHGRPQVLKHLPFFEVLAGTPEGSPEAKLATAGLLSLRMIDHWVLAGAAIVEPESVSVRSVRQAIMALPPKEPVREALLTIVNTMQMLRNVDLVPVLPRVFAYAQLLERHHGSMALAADAYRSVTRLADPEYDAELVLDTYHRLAFCERKVGLLDDAMETSTAMAKLATRRKDRVHALRAKMGMAQVAMMRGELAAADSQFVAIAKEAEHHDLMREFAMATHNRGVVAAKAGRTTDAVVLAHTALQLTTDPVEKDRVLSDLAALLIESQRFDAALDALRVLEVTASSDEPRAAARVNILVVAARTGNRELFVATHRTIDPDALPLEAKISFFAESALGFQAFGDALLAHEHLRNGEIFARSAGVVWNPDVGAPQPDGGQVAVSGEDADRTRIVVTSLREMASAIAA